MAGRVPRWLIWNRGCGIVSSTPPATTAPQPEVCDMCGHSSHYYDGKSGRAYVLSVEGRVYQIANGKRDYVEREVRRLFSSQEPDADRDVDAMIMEMPIDRFNPNAKDGDFLTCWVDDGRLTYVDLAQDLSIHISMQSVHVGPAAEGATGAGA